MTKHLENEISSLKRKLQYLTELVKKNVQKSILAMNERDTRSMEEVIDGDVEIDQMEVEIEEDCLKTLALHQPVAIDLRFIVGVLKINNELERAGDLAVNIAQRARQLRGLPVINTPFDYEDMSKKTFSMLNRAIQSLFEMNQLLAENVLKDDTEIDDLNRNMYQIIHNKIKDNPQHVVQLSQYLSVSRNLERMADIATNIAEDVLYMIDGRIHRHIPEV